MPKRFATWILALSIGLVAGAGAEDGNAVSAVAARAVRTVVEAQLAAFAADDAERAFSFASADIRQQFGDATTFMQMVRQGYPMLIRPATTSFLLPTGTEALVLQVIRVRDQGGRAWLAADSVQKQSDDSWRINGCAMRPDGDRGDDAST